MITYDKAKILNDIQMILAESDKDTHISIGEKDCQNAFLPEADICAIDCSNSEFHCLFDGLSADAAKLKHQKGEVLCWICINDTVTMKEYYEIQRDITSSIDSENIHFSLRNTPCPEMRVLVVLISI